MDLAPMLKQKCKSLQSSIKSYKRINSNLMDINYENIHYQRIGMFNGKLDKIPNAF